ncbi:MAG TPA: glycosyltransferase family 4 protein [Acidimicrobiales bacterium]|nr:glycosyltransferase family 4 protein [Acidimicrobiales bacterium]
MASVRGGDDGGAGAPLVFVTPRYGPGVVGGSEAVVAEAARGLAARGHRVEILTTCAKSHYSWANEFEAGSFVEHGVTVRRFATVAARSRVAAGELERRVQRSEHLSAGEEVAWVNGRFRVPDLYLHLVAHAASYRAIVLSPYLFWSTIYGADVAPERTIVMPCLHDEPYAWLEIVRETLSKVAGLWFLSEPEHQLTHRVAPALAPRHAVVGAAVEIPERYDPAGFKARHGLERPFIFYAGRREQGKGWRDLLAAYASAVARDAATFDLVTVGAGAPEIPEGLAGRVVDLGYLETEELPNAFAAAEALVQPSTNESFSRTLMEAWLAGTPVIANAAGEVVAWHCERSGGGLTYADESEFAHCLRFVAEAPKAAAALAAKGREYVLEHYRWEVVLDAMEQFLEDFPRR